MFIILTITHAPTTFILYVFLSSLALSTAQPEFEKRSNPLYLGFSLAIATAMAGVIFIVLKKFFRSIHMVQGQDDIEEPDHRASVGLDPYVLETFPMFKYSDVVAHRAGIGPLECSVCLSSFEVDDDDKDGELLVLLPKCNHVFHVGCVDPWFKGHTTCPLCRTDLVPNSDELTTQPGSPEMGSREGVVEVNGSDDNDLEVRGDIEEGQFREFRRWKSTGDATEVKSEVEDDWKRFTLKLTEEKMMEIGEKSGEFKRASSI